MRVWFKFGDSGRDAHVELPAAPRVGEGVLWVTEEESPDDGAVIEYRKQYRVRHVDWTISERLNMTATENPPVLIVHLEHVGEL
ncbi:hypothetical protein [Streptomyces sp. ME02-6979A]|uniref:hypothetical protein n=1 Tax=Streptomyces sp. ME02-6979A TaxID=3028674 RepID=UPI0029C098DC|nr:hypothetical protein [Streptomyces sp. ME02-6979A]